MAIQECGTNQDEKSQMLRELFARAGGQVSVHGQILIQWNFLQSLTSPLDWCADYTFYFIEDCFFFV